jgi:hypothetical protein
MEMPLAEAFDHLPVPTWEMLAIALVLFLFSRHSGSPPAIVLHRHEERLFTLPSLAALVTLESNKAPRAPHEGRV